MFTLGQFQKYLTERPGTVPDLEAVMKRAEEGIVQGKVLSADLVRELIGDKTEELLCLVQASPVYIELGKKEMWQVREKGEDTFPIPGD